MSGALSGNGLKIFVTPGHNLYFRTKASSDGCHTISAVQTLVSPERPDKPEFSVDFDNETTVEKAGADTFYTPSSTYRNPVSGTGTKVALTPGLDLYLWIKHSPTSFGSLADHLVVPARPAAPAFHINYENETTSETISSTIEYASTTNMSSATTGTGVRIALTPAHDLFFRVKATGSSFASLNYQLDVPARPAVVYTGPATVTSATITMRADLDASMTSFDLTDLSVTNGVAQNLRENNTFDVVGANKGDVKVIIPNNKFGGASFASNQVVVYYNKSTTGIAEHDNGDFIIYPNPSKTGILQIQTPLVEPYTIEVFTLEGGLVKTIPMEAGDTQLLNLQDLAKGVYYLKFKTKNIYRVQKVVIY